MVRPARPSRARGRAGILRRPVKCLGFRALVLVSILVALAVAVAPSASAQQAGVAKKVADGAPEQVAEAKAEAKPEKEPSPGFEVVVNAANPVEALHREEVARIFLNRVPRWEAWPGQPRIEPVDQPPSSEVRRRFTEAVHHKPVSRMVSFWQRMIFSGRGKPPMPRDDDAEVLAFVQSNEGGIGYVASGSTLPVGVKVVEILK